MQTIEDFLLEHKDEPIAEVDDWLCVVSELYHQFGISANHETTGGMLLDSLEANHTVRWATFKDTPMSSIVESENSFMGVFNALSIVPGLGWLKLFNTLNPITIVIAVLIIAGLFNTDYLTALDWLSIGTTLAGLF